jgi:hypothetical protein
MFRADYDVALLHSLRPLRLCVRHALILAADLPHVTQVERVAVANEHLPSEAGVIGVFEAGVGGEELFGLAASFFQNLLIATQVRNPQRRQAMLLRTK